MGMTKRVLLAAAIITLFAIIPALFMKTKKVTGRGPTVIAD